ncbi:MAG: hypothetical protein JST17_05595 [Bacteroidetes bacterium]|nr:hypothetical protein [Bacteroidota bacterium]MBS1931292.1 hypothetical protein [Bacteroidota bacterium]
MLTQLPGIIYIESQRGIVAEEGGETYCTFNYKNFSNGNKEPVPPLQCFNETILLPEGKARMNITGSCCFIIPVYNSVELTLKNQRVSVYPGEAMLLDNYHEVSVMNPEETENASFVWFTVDNGFNEPLFNKLSLPVDTIKNQWICLFTGDVNIKLACMDTREELEYNTLTSTNSKLFFYNIVGSFEVCGRLLNTNDGLVIWDCNKAEIEALSPDSIILIMEL